MKTLPFVGRQQELTSLRDTCAKGAAAIVIGDAGLGKSRLIAELCADDTLICTVAVGAVELQTSPYAIFRTLALQWSRLLEPQSLEWSEGQLAHLGPLFPALQSSDATNRYSAEERRHGLWISLLRYLDEMVAAQDKRLVTIVEDLHAVDDDSVRLFTWLASQPIGMASVATSRPKALAEVAGLPTIGLRPLGHAEVEAIRRDAAATSTDAQTLLDLTAGIPLRLHEWFLGSQLAGPTHAQGALLDRVLDGCTEIALEALRLTAVFPGQIDAELLASVIETDTASASAALADAESRGVLLHNRDGRWSFHHESYRAALLDGLTQLQRRGYERRLVRGLRGQLDSRPDLLGHIASISTGLREDRVDAAQLHLAAGHYAAVQLSPADAQHHYEAAAELAEATDQHDLTLESLLSLGLVLAGLGDPAAATVLAKVYPLAETYHDGDSFALAALAEPASLGHIGIPLMTNHRIVARLRSALAKVTDSQLRARVLIALALHQHNSLNETQYYALLDQAQELTDPLNDPFLDGEILAARVGVRRPPHNASELQQLVDARLERLEPFDPNALAMLDLAVVAACRSGDLSVAESLIRRCEDEFAPLPIVAQWSVLRTRTAFALARGSVEIARTLALQGLNTTAGTRHDATALEHFGFQITALLRERRKIEEARPTIETWVTEHPSYAAFRASRAWLYGELGEFGAARSDLEIFFAQDLQELRGRIEGPISVSMALSAAFTVGGPAVEDWCRQGYELLMPLADEWLVLGQGSLIEGPVIRVLALASSALGEVERALVENAEAYRRAQEAGALLFVWHAIRDRGLILRNAGRTSAAIESLREASGRYRSAGLTQQAGWLAGVVNDLQASVSAEPRPHRSIEANLTIGEFQRDHRFWHVRLGDEIATCRHLKGMPMIAALLSTPGKEVAAGLLAAIGDGEALTPRHTSLRTGVAQVLADEQAVTAYRRRLDQIVTELDRADRRGDAASSARLSAEFDAITAELAATHGLGGRRRTMTNEDERARVRVNKAIRSSIRRVGEQAPGLAAYLERSINTGLFCSYRPDPLRQVAWNVTM